MNSRRTTSRVALVQSTIGYDGRSQVLAHLIRLLNDRGATPELLTFSSESDAALMEENIGIPLRYSLVRLGRPRTAKGHQFEQLAIARLAQRRLKGFDLVYASDTSVYGYDSAQKMLRLICFPIERVPEYEERYRRPLLRAYGLAGKLVTGTLRRRFTPHGIWIANSEFTADVIRKTYGLPEDGVEVIPPPVAAAVRPPGTRERLVLSIGGFHEDKRQIEQIGLAARIPDVEFVLAGSRRSETYLDQCRRIADALPNVRLVPDAAPDACGELLGRAKVFLHSKRFEHFGMSTVEGMLAGCIPVVHDSGGQREVVPHAELRFRDEHEAEERIRAAVEGKFDSLLPALQRHARSYDVETFERRMGSLLDKALA